MYLTQNIHANIPQLCVCKCKLSPRRAFVGLQDTIEQEKIPNIAFMDIV